MDDNSDEDEEEKEDSKFDKILKNLESDDVEAVKITIGDLNTEFYMSNESHKGSTKPRRFIKPLLNFLGNKFDPELMMKASNCLVSLIDLFPEMSDHLIDENGLKVIEEKATNIQYIDVTED